MWSIDPDVELARVVDEWRRGRVHLQASGVGERLVQIAHGRHLQWIRLMKHPRRPKRAARPGMEQVALCEKELQRAGRGGHLVEEDLIPALDAGQLSGAVLDVVRQEPLPAAHPFWVHPRIILTPHIAAETHPPTAAAIIRDAVGRFEAGLPLANRIDLARGY